MRPGARIGDTGLPWTRGTCFCMCRLGPATEVAITALETYALTARAAVCDFRDGQDYLAGRPLQGLVDGSAKDWPLEVFVQISESTCGRAVRTKRWTYCVEAPKGQARFGSRDSEVYHEAFLYDLQATPGQRKNLVASAEHEKVRAELCEVLLRRMAGAGEKPPKILPKV